MNASPVPGAFAPLASPAGASPLVGGTSFLGTPTTSPASFGAAATTPALGPALQQTLVALNQLVASLQPLSGPAASSGPLPTTMPPAGTEGGGPTPKQEHVGGPGCTCGCQGADRPKGPPPSPEDLARFNALSDADKKKAVEFFKKLEQMTPEQRAKVPEFFRKLEQQRAAAAEKPQDKPKPAADSPRQGGERPSNAGGGGGGGHDAQAAPPSGGGGGGGGGSRPSAPAPEPAPPAPPASGGGASGNGGNAAPTQAEVDRWNAAVLEEQKRILAERWAANPGSFGPPDGASGNEAEKRKDLEFLRGGIGGRADREAGGAANSGPAKVTYDIPDGKGNTHVVIESDGVGKKSKAFTYHGRSYVLTVDFVSEGNRYKAKSVSIDPR